MRSVPRMGLLMQLTRVLWAATLVTIPVTSFRYFPAGEGTYVRPLALLPLAALLLVLVLRWLRGEGDPPRPGSLVPLAAFVLMAALASAAGMLLDPIPMRGQDVAGRILRAWVTLLMGLGFFIGAAWMNRNDSELRFSVKWLLVGFAANVLWSGVQAATFYLDVLPKPLVTQWQRLFSLRELIRTNRISGLTYEPSWLAGQIATVYLPWLLAAALTRWRVFRFRWLEPLLLAAAVLMVLATYSRGGILTAGLSSALVVFFAARAELRSAWHRLAAERSGLTALVVRIGIVVFAVLVVGGAGLWLAQKGYVSRLWESRADDFVGFLVQNSAGARGAYLTSAIQTYYEHPWTGVGLGASGLYIYSRIPDWALTSVPEIARQLSPESNLYPNPKNLYVRLLAETGLPGLVIFGSFMLTLLAEALGALRRGTQAWRYVGMAGLCTWLAISLYSMTQDSFATPNLWLNLGMLAGLTGLAAQRSDKVVRVPAPGPVAARSVPMRRRST
jgi:O-antigen ligase